jgi:thiosulfate sulfurtransferase
LAEFKHISVADTAQHLAADSATICDIRDEKSFGIGHINNSLHLTNHTMGKLLTDVDYSRPVIVVCYHGNSSQSAAQYLAEQGFDEVYSMDGGFAQWAKEQPSVSD